MWECLWLCERVSLSVTVNDCEKLHVSMWEFVRMRRCEWEWVCLWSEEVSVNITGHVWVFMSVSDCVSVLVTVRMSVWDCGRVMCESMQVSIYVFVRASGWVWLSGRVKRSLLAWRAGGWALGDGEGKLIGVWAGHVVWPLLRASATRKWKPQGAHRCRLGSQEEQTGSWLYQTG